MAFGTLLTLFVACSAVLASPTAVKGFDDDTLAKVKTNLQTIATHSWEIGTELETLTELEWPELSVFHGAIPPPAQLASSHIAADVIAKATAIVNNISDPTAVGPLIDGDGAVGDPASIGVAVLLTNWTRTDPSDDKFALAAQNQLEYLLTVAPRTDDGAISHRESEVQLWADFVYMAPPFIAYYGAIQGGANGTALLSEAYNQCKLYRQYLRDVSGLWKHIVLGSSQDNNHWGTGNAWAAAGMLRVLETIARSNEADNFRTEQEDLLDWINEILTAAWTYQHVNGTLYNYIDQDTSFADSASTALLGAVSFRLATVNERGHAHIPNAYRALQVIKASVNEGGWLLNTVDPETFDTPSLPGSYSPEGQAFVLLLHAAWRDFEEFSKPK
ncbi:Six-hairpin glycosidase-like protein [Dichomitus squalens]|uniref:Six-hairpin glycosidase-like protein n=1 Tax=Dichomitus squalens TaxID=114155 RepID=A0A4Q9MYQ2_9APHY|nr:Six-hairpin glycosidase-like protein [Dichomitus squalens]